MKMKIEVQVIAIVVRDKDTKELLDIQILKSWDSEVTVKYPPKYVSIEEITEYALRIFGDSAERAMATEITAVALGKEFSLSGEAKDIPSIGRIQVSIESKEIEWE